MPTPDKNTVAAWIELARAHRRGHQMVEARLKSAGLAPLAWYDALWELEKAGKSGLRPFELERALLFEQYNLSRLVDRLSKAGLVVRAACPDDGRGQVLTISDRGRATRAAMWRVYGSAIEEAIGKQLDRTESETLTTLLTRLGRDAAP